MDLTLSHNGRKALFALLYLSEGAPIGLIWWAVRTRLREAGVPVGTITLLTSAIILPWAISIAPPGERGSINGSAGRHGGRRWLFGAGFLVVAHRIDDATAVFAMVAVIWTTTLVVLAASERDEYHVQDHRVVGLRQVAELQNGLLRDTQADRFPFRVRSAQEHQTGSRGCQHGEYAMKKFFFSTVVAIAVALPGAAMADHRLGERAALGAALGAAVGAYVGAEVAGADGGVIGAALGGAVGARVTTRDQTRSRYYSTPVNQYRVVEYRHHDQGPRHFCPPGLAKQGRC